MNLQRALTGTSMPKINQHRGVPSGLSAPPGHPQHHRALALPAMWQRCPERDKDVYCHPPPETEPPCHQIRLLINKPLQSNPLRTDAEELSWLQRCCWQRASYQSHFYTHRDELSAMTKEKQRACCRDVGQSFSKHWLQAVPSSPPWFPTPLILG